MTEQRPLVTWCCINLIAWSLLSPVPVLAASAAVPLVSWHVSPTAPAIAAALTDASLGALPAGYPPLATVPYIPPTILDAIAWVESSWRQYASSGTPLVSYGGAAGIMQVVPPLDGITATRETLSALENNYLYNIAAGAHVLGAKWLQTPIVGDGDPAVIENWYYAIWAYNDWGWANNPLNPRFTRQGTPLTHPWTFPYQERIFYLIAHPPRDASGRPLWPAVLVTLPALSAFSSTPGALPSAALPTTHADPALLTGQAALPLAVPTADNAQVLATAGASAQPSLVATAGRHMQVAVTVQNTGGLFWPAASTASTGYTLRLLRGWPGLVAPAQSLPGMVPPGASGRLTLAFTAPPISGTVSAAWQVVDAHGQVVGAPLTLTLHVTHGVHSSSITSGPLADGYNDASFAGDTTLPDGTIEPPGHAFHKGWMIRNTGTLAWNPAYHLHFEAGQKMGPTISLRAPVTAPGGVASFSVTLFAPLKAGRYLSIWQMTDQNGQVFGQQVWVIIVVTTSGVATATVEPSLVPPTATATPTTAPTDRPAPVETPTATPRPTPRPTPPEATASPLPHPASSVGLPTGAATDWVGPVVFRRYFAEGYTGGHTHEYVSLYNPSSGTTHVRLSLERLDGASRIVQVTLAGQARRTLDIAAYAPHASTALVVEADRPLAVERAMYLGAGGTTSTGTAAPARHWTFVHILVGTGYDEWLSVYNPNWKSATLDMQIQTNNGLMRTVSLSAAAHRRINIHLTTLLPALDTTQRIEVQASVPLVVEHMAYYLVNTAQASGQTLAAQRSAAATVPSLMGTTGLPQPHTTWYFPAGQTDGGKLEYLPIYNPNATTTLVTVTLMLNDGSWVKRWYPVAGHSWWMFTVHHLAQSSNVGAEVDSSSPVVVSEANYLPLRRGGSLVPGLDHLSTIWYLTDGYTQNGFADTISVFNPHANAVTVTVHYVTGTGVSSVAQHTIAGYSCGTWSATNDAPASSFSATLSASSPVAVARAATFNRGWGLTIVPALPAL